MTAQQALSFGIIVCTIVIFAWGRFRFDVVSLCALLVAVVTGDVPAKQAFTGFTSDVVVIIACALVVSAAVQRSGAVEAIIRPIVPRLKSAATQVPALAAATAVLSMLTKNVGALAILMPTALRLGKGEKSSPTALLMPMSFLSLLGGLVTLVGTSTNIIVSQVRQDEIGQPFQMFDFAPVGLVLTALGLAFVSFGWRLLPRDRQGRAELKTVAADAAYATEAVISHDLPDNVSTVADLKLDEDGVEPVALVTPAGERQPARPDQPLAPGGSLVLQGSDTALAAAFGRLPLAPARDEKEPGRDEPSEELRSVEAVIQPDSRLIGKSAKRVDLQQQYGIRLVGVSRRGERITDRLRDVTLRAGDVLILQAGEKALPEVMQALSLLPLAERMVKLGSRRQRWLPLAILAVAIVLVAAKVLPVAAGFFGAAVLVVATGTISMREAYGALEPEVLILIGALTPLSEAVQRTGGTTLVAHALTAHLQGAPGLLVIGALMLTAMACSPFLHNAPTTLVLGPIAIAIGKGLNLSPDAFLMAVATGAGCDFLTPVGHQCNTLVWGPGGYRFGDYWKLGLPLSILVILVGTPMIAWVWPLTQH